MGLFDYFRNNKRQKDNDQPFLFFHEDDFRQIELIPKENFDQAKSQSNEILEFSEKNFDGIGYTNIYIRNDNNIHLQVRKISVEELDELLLKIGFYKVPKVITGYGQDYRVIASNTIGFGQDYAAIYYDFQENIVTNIWLTQPYNINMEKIISFLEEVGKKWDLLLADWEATEIIDLSDKEAIINYLS